MLILFLTLFKTRKLKKKNSNVVGIGSNQMEGYFVFFFFERKIKKENISK
jgi:hypothetical protein